MRPALGLWLPLLEIRLDWAETSQKRTFYTFIQVCLQNKFSKIHSYSYTFLLIEISTEGSVDPHTGVRPSHTLPLSPGGTLCPDRHSTTSHQTPHSCKAPPGSGLTHPTGARMCVCGAMKFYHLWRILYPPPQGPLRLPFITHLPLSPYPPSPASRSH